MTMDKMPNGTNLVKELTENLPLVCYSNKRNTRAMAAQGLRLSEKTALEVVRVFDMGEYGGVVCELKNTGSARPIIASITGLDFRDNGPVDGKIRAYKNARLAWLVQEELRGGGLGRPSRGNGE